MSCFVLPILLLAGLNIIFNGFISSVGGERGFFSALNFVVNFAEVSLPRDAWDWLRNFIVAFPRPSVKHFIEES